MVFLEIKEVSVAGFRNVKIRKVEEILGVIKKALPASVFQFFDADRVAGKRHLEVAALYAKAAFKGEYAVSRNLGIEAILYASCQRQIGRALEMVGVGPETSRVAVLYFGQEAENFFNMIGRLLGWTRDDGLLEGWAERLEELEKIYKVSKIELKATMEALDVEEAEAFLRLLWERMGLLASQV